MRQSHSIEYMTFSMMSDFRQCPHRYFKNYVQEPREVRDDSEDFIFAQSFRQDVAGIFATIASEDALIGTTYRTCQIAALRDVTSKDSKYSLLLANLGTFACTKLADHRVVAVDRLFQLEKPVPVRGRVDLITRDNNGRHLLLFWRTGKPPRYDQARFDNMKGVCAIHWAKQEYCASNVDAWHVFLREVSYWRVVESNAVDIRWTRTELRREWTALRSTTAYPTCKSRLCDWCKWKSGCPEFGHVA